MMRILRKIKLPLFWFGLILSSCNIYAMVDDSEEKIEYGITRNYIAFSPEFFEDPTLPSSSQELKKNSIPKNVLENISARLGPIGALLPTFEHLDVSPRKKERHIGVRGERDILEISNPSSNMEMKSVQEFEKELPNRLREFSDRFNAIYRKKLTKKQGRDFQQLFLSFRDIEEIYQNYNPDYQSIPEERQRRFFVKRRASINVIQRNKVTGSPKSTPTTTESDQVIISSSLPLDALLSSKERTGEGILSVELPLSSSAPPRPLRAFERISQPATLSLTPFQRLPNGSSPSYRPLPIPPSSAERSFSSSTPTSPRPPRLNNGSSTSFRPLPAPPKPHSSSSIPSSPPPAEDSLMHLPLPPPLPPRSRSLSTPVKKDDSLSKTAAL